MAQVKDTGAAQGKPGYIPALSLRVLTPLYDPLLRWIMREDRIKRALIRSAEIEGGRVLEVGCGTGTLTILAKLEAPAADVTGLDPDRSVLARAQAKTAAAGVRLALHQGSATSLPYPDETFEVVLASLVLHHLGPAALREALHEIRRVLRPGGRLMVTDFGPPRSLLTRIVTPVMIRLEHTAPFFAGELPAILSRAGFAALEPLDEVATIFGRVVSARTVRPARR